MPVEVLLLHGLEALFNLVTGANRTRIDVSKALCAPSQALFESP